MNCIFYSFLRMIPTYTREQQVEVRQGECVIRKVETLADYFRLEHGNSAKRTLTEILQLLKSHERNPYPPSFHLRNVRNCRLGAEIIFKGYKKVHGRFWRLFHRTQWKEIQRLYHEVHQEIKTAEPQAETSLIETYRRLSPYLKKERMYSVGSLYLSYLPLSQLKELKLLSSLEDPVSKENWSHLLIPLKREMVKRAQELGYPEWHNSNEEWSQEYIDKGDQYLEQLLEEIEFMWKNSAIISGDHPLRHHPWTPMNKGEEADGWMEKLKLFPTLFTRQDFERSLGSEMTYEKKSFFQFLIAHRTHFSVSDASLTEGELRCAMSRAIERAPLDLAKLFLEWHPDHTRHCHALGEAADQGKIELMAFLIEEKGVDVNTTVSTYGNNAGVTPLHQAAHRGYPQAVQFLLERGANIQAQINPQAGYITGKPLDWAYHGRRFKSLYTRKGQEKQNWNEVISLLKNAARRLP